MPDTIPFRMPSLGADMEVGTVLEWRVGPGDAVAPGDIVALVDTEKAEIEVEIFDAGVIDHIVVPCGVEVPVGTLLAELAPAGARPAEGRRPPVEVPTVGVVAPRAETGMTISAAPSGPSGPGAPVAGPVAARRPSHPPLHAQPHVLSPLVRHLAEARHVDLDHLRGSGTGGRVMRSDVEHAPGRRRVSPRARRLAEAWGLDLEDLQGTGPGGAVIGDDVIARATPAGGPPAAVPAPAVAPTTGPGARSRAIAERTRAAIAASMTRSWHEIPHYHVATRIDVSQALRSLDERNAARSVSQRVLPAALLLRAVAVSARRHPTVNGWWVDGAFRPSPSVDLGVVVALRGGGLVSPTITGADALTLDELMARLQDVVTRARRGRLRSSDAAPASLTVTNLGDLGVEEVYGIIHPPQVGLVGFGAIHEEPWAVDGMVGARPVVHATFAGDHRASDGLAGAAFLRSLDEAIRQPADL